MPYKAEVNPHGKWRVNAVKMVNNSVNFNDDRGRPNYEFYFKSPYFLGNLENCELEKKPEWLYLEFFRVLL